ARCDKFREEPHAGLPEHPYNEHKKREGGFSCETSPSLFPISEIRFGFRITTLAFRESLVAYELTPAGSLHFSDHCRRKNSLAATRFQLPGPSLVADSRR